MAHRFGSRKSKQHSASSDKGVVRAYVADGIMGRARAREGRQHRGKGSLLLLITLRRTNMGPMRSTTIPSKGSDLGDSSFSYHCTGDT